MSVHEGHRQRMRRQLKTSGMDSLSDVQVLEVLLYYAIPRADTNPIAHRLLERFGSLSGVLEAAPDELSNIEGMGDAAAQLKREDVLRQLARLAFGRVDDAVTLALRRGETEPEGLELSAVSELRVTEKGVEVKLVDRVRALETLWKLLEASEPQQADPLLQALATLPGETGDWNEK